jgi:hypothetical protein
MLLKSGFLETLLTGFGTMRVAEKSGVEGTRIDVKKSLNVCPYM